MARAHSKEDQIPPVALSRISFNNRSSCCSNPNPFVKTHIPIINGIAPINIPPLGKIMPNPKIIRNMANGTNKRARHLGSSTAFTM